MQRSENLPRQTQSSYVKRFNLITGSALEEAECFVASLKTLQSSLNNTSNNPVELETDLKNTLDQYVRLTMVCDVLKVFNPFKSPSPSPQPQGPPPSIEPLAIKQEPTEIKPAHLLRDESIKPERFPPTTILNGTRLMDGTHHYLSPALQSRLNVPVKSNEKKNESVPKSTKDVSPRQPNTNASRDEVINIPNQKEITSEKFIATFEALLTYFSNANKLSMDDTWEKLFIHSLPAQHKQWFNQKLQGKHYTWEDAKKLFFAEIDSKLPMPQAGRSEGGRVLARKTRYAEALLALEMKDNDNLVEFNQRFKRYSECAGMTCDSSLLKRYVNSLAKRYREVALPLLNHPNYANNLVGLMAYVERLDDTQSLVEVDVPCPHNWSIGTTFKSTWTPSKKRPIESDFEVEKRVRTQPVA